MINPMDYAIVLNSKKVRGSGLSPGQEVMIISTKVLPEKRSDPYLQRVYVVAVLLDENGLPLIPNSSKKEDNGHRGYLLDPRNLQKIEGERKTHLKKLLEEKHL